MNKLSETIMESSRLRLLPVNLTFRHEIFMAFTSEVTRYMFPKPPVDISETDEFIRTSIEKMRNGEEIVFAITLKQNDEFIGCAGIHSLNSNTPILGIWTKIAVHGNGYGRETIHTLYNWLCENKEFDYVIYPVDRRNKPSRKIPESLGGVVGNNYTQKNMDNRELEILEYRMYR